MDPVMTLTIFPTVILWLVFLAVWSFVRDNSDVNYCRLDNRLLGRRAR